MSLWREELIPINPYTRPGTKLRLVRNIVIHWTANPGASAANHVRYFGQTLPAAKDRYASAHIFIDSTDSVLIIPLDEVAYHAEQANPYSIGIEMCVEKDGSFHPNTVRRAIEVTAALCKQYGLNPMRDVIRHNDVTGKICPKPYVDDPAAWEAFRAAVDRVMRGEETEGDDTMNLELWQWKMLGDALDGMYRKGLIGDYTWAEKAYTATLTSAELSWLNMITFARGQGVEV